VDEEATGTKEFCTALGHDIVFVDREQLRCTTLNKMFVPSQSLYDAPLPTPPTVVDWTKSNTAKLPILGNDRYGCCFYVAPLHMFQVWLWAQAQSKTLEFDVNAVVRRYLQLSPRDSGLGDQQVFPEMLAGMIGPNGPNKILDTLLVDPTDRALVKLVIWRFGGALWTASLSSSWKNNISPGVTWDVGRPNRNLGHAMFLSGADADTYKSQTWGLNPPVNVTFPGLESCDPEIIACIGMEWYDAAGMSPAGFHYTEDAALWVQLGGKALPPSPFPDKPAPIPVPPPGPAPAPLTSPFTVAFAVDPATSTITVTPPIGYGVNVNSEPPAAK
jgi:hypothetical protein